MMTTLPISTNHLTNQLYTRNTTTNQSTNQTQVRNITATTTTRLAQAAANVDIVTQRERAIVAFEAGAEAINHITRDEYTSKGKGDKAFALATGAKVYADTITIQAAANYVTCSADNDLFSLYIQCFDIGFSSANSQYQYLNDLKARGSNTPPEAVFTQGFRACAAATYTDGTLSIGVTVIAGFFSKADAAGFFSKADAAVYTQTSAVILLNATIFAAGAEAAAKCARSKIVANSAANPAIIPVATAIIDATNTDVAYRASSFAAGTKALVAVVVAKVTTVDVPAFITGFEDAKAFVVARTTGIFNFVPGSASAAFGIGMGVNSENAAALSIGMKVDSDNAIIFAKGAKTTAANVSNVADRASASAAANVDTTTQHINAIAFAKGAKAAAANIGTPAHRNALAFAAGVKAINHITGDAYINKGDQAFAFATGAEVYVTTVTNQAAVTYVTRVAGCEILTDNVWLFGVGFKRANLYITDLGDLNITPVIVFTAGFTACSNDAHITRKTKTTESTQADIDGYYAAAVTTGCFAKASAAVVDAQTYNSVTLLNAILFATGAKAAAKFTRIKSNTSFAANNCITKTVKKKANAANRAASFVAGTEAFTAVVAAKVITVDVSAFTAGFEDAKAFVVATKLTTARVPAFADGSEADAFDVTMKVDSSSALAFVGGAKVAAIISSTVTLINDAAGHAVYYAAEAKALVTAVITQFAIVETSSVDAFDAANRFNLQIIVGSKNAFTFATNAATAISEAAAAINDFAVAISDITDSISNAVTAISDASAAISKAATAINHVAVINNVAAIIDIVVTMSEAAAISDFAVISEAAAAIIDAAATISDVATAISDAAANVIIIAHRIEVAAAISDATTCSDSAKAHAAYTTSLKILTDLPFTLAAHEGREAANRSASCTAYAKVLVDDANAKVATTNFSAFAADLKDIKAFIVAATISGAKATTFNIGIKVNAEIVNAKNAASFAISAKAAAALIIDSNATVIGSAMLLLRPRAA